MRASRLHHIIRVPRISSNGYVVQMTSSSRLVGTMRLPNEQHAYHIVHGRSTTDRRREFSSGRFGRFLRHLLSALSPPFFLLLPDPHKCQQPVRLPVVTGCGASFRDTSLSLAHYRTLHRSLSLYPYLSHTLDRHLSSTRVRDYATSFGQVGSYRVFVIVISFFTTVLFCSRSRYGALNR